MSKAYIIFLEEITNPEQFAIYRQWSSRAIASFDAKILVRGGNTETLEGITPPRTVILEFPSIERAREFYHSMQYLRARNAREGAVKMNCYIIEGYEPI